MKIKSIHIKNVRGLGDHVVELNMIPNKPSILVAPNGSGKSSFAFAFQWLNRLRMKLNDDDAYQGDIHNKPSIDIVTDDDVGTYHADENTNHIKDAFGIYVINSGLISKSPGLNNGFRMGRSRITIPEIVLIDNVPDVRHATDNFDEIHDTNALPQGYYPVISNLLANNSFMASLNVKELSCTNTRTRKVIDFIDRSKTYTGTIAERYAKIQSDDYDQLIGIPAVSYAIEAIRKFATEDNAVKLLMKAVRLVTLCYRDKDALTKSIEYSQYKLNEQDCLGLFASLNTTWKNIAPHKTGSKVTLNIGDAQRISNGERDILVFIANLFRARTSLVKENNILIIDEVFDYLDDANLMAAQYYITKLIKDLKAEGKNLFPIILSHINPDYFGKHYSFKDMKVYYLCNLPHPHVSDNMMTLLRRRKVLSQAAGARNEDDISKFMLHFYNDYPLNMARDIAGCPREWADINVFKRYCRNQLDDYLAVNQYDPLAVCVALREIIESNIYNELNTDQKRSDFLNTHGTAKKLEYAEEHSVEVPELYYLLGNIYNDPMHVDNKSQKLITLTLYARMENNTIRNMIRFVRDESIETID